jgi:DNA mismatch repair protein MutS2
MKQNNKVGVLAEIRGKKAIVNLGAMPLQVNFADLTTVVEKDPKCRSLPDLKHSRFSIA